MNARVYAVQQCATEVGLCASRVALLGGTEVSQAARSFANTASGLAAALVKNTKMGDVKVLDNDNEAGYVEPRPDFVEFDTQLDLLYQALATEFEDVG
jgi:hypothetical protein